MKPVVLVIVFAMALGLTAYAQSPTTGDPQSTPQGTNPSAQPSAQPQTSPSQVPDMSGSANQTQDQSKEKSKGEKKLKGCIQSEGGKFVLQEKGGKEIALAGSQDFSSHVGHTVTLHGTYGSGSDMGSSASAGASSPGDQFMVSKIDMVSDTCKGEKASDKSKDKDSSKPSPYRQ